MNIGIFETQHLNLSLVWYGHAGNQLSFHRKRLAIRYLFGEEMRRYRIIIHRVYQTEGYLTLYRACRKILVIPEYRFS
jgi:hypothetical protein